MFHHFHLYKKSPAKLLSKIVLLMKTKHTAYCDWILLNHFKNTNISQFNNIACHPPIFISVQY